MSSSTNATLKRPLTEAAVLTLALESVEMGRQLTLTSALRWLQDNRYHVDKVSLRYAFVEWLPELVPDRWFCLILFALQLLGDWHLLRASRHECGSV